MSANYKARRGGNKWPRTGFVIETKAGTGLLRIMRPARRRFLSLLAIYAVALHTIFLGFAPIAAATAAATDPFSVICHSVTPVDQSGGQADHLLPGHACEHCNLCSAAAPPAAPDIAVFAVMAPMRFSHRLVPVSAPPRSGIASNPEQARGPPRFV
jgi:hypothetical protein